MDHAAQGVVIDGGVALGEVSGGQVPGGEEIAPAVKGVVAIGGVSRFQTFVVDRFAIVVVGGAVDLPVDEVVCVLRAVIVEVEPITAGVEVPALFVNRRAVDVGFGRVELAQVVMLQAIEAVVASIGLLNP
jgi:hypothetical protein